MQNHVIEKFFSCLLQNCFAILCIVLRLIMTDNTGAGNNMDTLEWIQLQESIDNFNLNERETFFQRAKRKTFQNPIAPIGLFLF